MNLTRRKFLTFLGAGAAVAAVPAIIMPERRIWQVGATLSKPIDVYADWYSRHLQQHVLSDAHMTNDGMVGAQTYKDGEWLLADARERIVQSFEDANRAAEAYREEKAGVWQQWIDAAKKPTDETWSNTLGEPLSPSVESLRWSLPKGAMEKLHWRPKTIYVKA